MGERRGGVLAGGNETVAKSTKKRKTFLELVFSSGQSPRPTPKPSQAQLTIFVAAFAGRRRHRGDRGHALGRAAIAGGGNV